MGGNYQQGGYQPGGYPQGGYPGGGYPGGGYPGGPPQKNPGQGLGIAGMVCGIVGLVFAFFLSWAVFPILCAITGLVLSAIAMKKSKEAGFPAGMAVAGLVCSCIAIGWNIICIIIFCTAISSVTSGLGALGALW